MKDKSLRWGDKITPQNITRDYDDVISRNQIRGSKMAVLKLALLGEQERQTLSEEHICDVGTFFT